MIKLYITAAEYNEDGSLVVLFEDYMLKYEDSMLVGIDDNLGYKISKKIEEAELANEQASSPL